MMSETDENSWLFSIIDTRLKKAGIKPRGHSTDIELHKRVIRAMVSELIQEAMDRQATKLEDRHLNLSAIASTIHGIWGDALDGLEIYIMICDEIGDEFVDRFRSPTHKYDTVEALARLHAQAVLVASEILTLLRAGYVSGANARWRTLYELAVISWFIRDKGDETAERYLEHVSVEGHKVAVAYKEHEDILGTDLMTEERLREIDEVRKHLLMRFGPEYNEQYGWAAKALGIKRPSFVDIEKAINFQAMRPIFKILSHNVHARPDGMLENISVLTEEQATIFRGPTTVGLANPAQGAAFGLFYVTLSLLATRANARYYTLLEVIDQILDKVVHKFTDAQKAALQATRK